MNENYLSVMCSWSSYMQSYKPLILTRAINSFVCFISFGESIIVYKYNYQRLPRINIAKERDYLGLQNSAT